MTRQRVGWGLVVLAGILLLVQLAPTLAKRKGAPTALGQFKVIQAHPELYSSPPSATHYDLAPGAAGSRLLLVDRAGDGAVAEVLSPEAELDGHVRFRTRGQPGEAGRSQSPDGTIVAEGTLLTGRGESADLAALSTAARLSSFTWREDSGGACALDGDGTRGTFLVVFGFPPGGLGPIRIARFTLPADLSYQGQLGPSILSCAGSGNSALVAITDPARGGRVAEINLLSGAEQASRSFSPVRGGFVASPDGKLVAVNGGAGANGSAASPTTVTEFRSGRVLLSLDGSRLVRAFSANNQAVLVSPEFQSGASLLAVADGAPRWTDSSDRALVGWQVVPGSGQIAVALGHRRLETCTKGEPGKFPQFCRFETVQDLLVVPGTGGNAGSLGKGVGIWGYAVS